MTRPHALLSFSLLLTACAAEVPGPASAPVVPDENLPPTTDGEIALANLDFRIESTERLLAAADDLGLRAELISLLAQRARFRGSFEDYDRADALSAELVAGRPDERSVQLTRASVLAGLHRFEEAHALLDRVEGAEDLVLAARLPMWIASADPGPWVEQARGRALSNPSFSTYVALGSALAARGDFVGADGAFIEAAATYRDVSPFAIAWLQFQRGVMWSERAGDTERGRWLYEDAVARLGRYVTANVHLAEIQREDDVEGAIRRLEAIASDTSDPEPMGLLGELLIEVGRSEEGRRWVEEARRLYVDLLRRHRAAFADHAAEFYLGVGDEPATALELARDNLSLRRTERAYSLAIRAALAADRRDEACAFALEVRDRVYTGVELDQDLPAGLAACPGDR